MKKTKNINIRVRETTINQIKSIKEKFNQLYSLQIDTTFIIEMGISLYLRSLIKQELNNKE